MKFKFVGIKIYAAIDAYLRYITWIYVRITGCTQISVLFQYLNTLQSGEILPALLRADQGVETPMVADAHFAISEAACVIENGLELQFKDCFRYGKSTKINVLRHGGPT